MRFEASKEEWGMIIFAGLAAFIVFSMPFLAAGWQIAFSGLLVYYGIVYEFIFMQQKGQSIGS